MNRFARFFAAVAAALLILTGISVPAYAGYAGAEAVASSAPALPAWLLNDTASWAMIAGVLSPLLIALFNQPGWSKATRQFIAVAVGVVLGLLDCLATGAFTDVKTVLAAVAVVLTASWASYKTLLGHVAGAVEAASSPSRDRYDLSGRGY